MRIAFKKTFWKWGVSPLGILILLRTLSNYNHCELIFSDGMSFSAGKGRDDGNEVGFKKIGYSHPERWDFLDVKITKKQEKQIRLNAEKIHNDNDGYDFLGILFNELIPLDIENKRKYYCSEVIAVLLGLRFSTITPQDLYNYYGG